MKEYIYLDEKFMKSVLSQEFGGITHRLTKGRQSSEGQTDTTVFNSGSTSYEGNLGVPALVQGKIKHEKETRSDSTSNEVKTVGNLSEDIETLDSIYNNFEEFILRADGFESLEKTFELIDLDLLIEILTSEQIKSFMVKSHEDTYDSTINEFNRDQRRALSSSNKGKYVKKQMEGYEESLSGLLLAELFLPSSKLVASSDGMIVCPLIDSHVQLETKQISLFYKDTKTKILGKKIGLMADSLGTNISKGVWKDFGEILLTFTQAVFEIVGIENDATLYMPICWYQDHSLRSRETADEE